MLMKTNALLMAVCFFSHTHRISVGRRFTMAQVIGSISLRRWPSAVGDSIAPSSHGRTSQGKTRTSINLRKIDENNSHPPCSEHSRQHQLRRGPALFGLEPSDQSGSAN